MADECASFYAASAPSTRRFLNRVHWFDYGRGRSHTRSRKRAKRRSTVASLPARRRRWLPLLLAARQRPRGGRRRGHSASLGGIGFVSGVCALNRLAQPATWAAVRMRVWAHRVMNSGVAGTVGGRAGRRRAGHGLPRNGAGPTRTRAVRVRACFHSLHFVTGDSRTRTSDLQAVSVRCVSLQLVVWDKRSPVRIRAPRPRESPLRRALCCRAWGSR